MHRSNDEPKAVCKHCGGDRIDVDYIEHGRAAAIVGRDDDGTPYLAYMQEKRAEDCDEDNYRCADCGKSAWKLAELVTFDAPKGGLYRPGDYVFCPDNCKGIVETVDEEERTLTVIGWHETFAWTDVAECVQLGTV